MGCVTIWPTTVPKTESSRREVETLSLPVGERLNPANQGQEIVDVVDRSGLVVSASCMTMREIHTPSMMQDSCMYHSNLDKLLSVGRMRRKIQIKQKTKKILC